jgi:chromosome partitioning protein
MNWLTRSRKFHVKHPDSDTADRSLEGPASGTREGAEESSVEGRSAATGRAAGPSDSGRRRETFIPAVASGSRPGDLAAALQRTADLPTVATDGAETQDAGAGESEIPLEIAPVEPSGPKSTSAERSSAATTPPATPGFDDSTPLARELADITRRRRAVLQQELPLPTATRIFTVANQKGGVGKTTSTVNLAAALARQGARVLVIDLDPQGNASTGLGVEHRSDTASVYDVIINDVPMAEVIQKSPEFDALFVVPATIHLAGAEIELVSLVAREQRLRTSLDAFLAEAPDEYHYVFIDCPPSLGLLTINAFVAAREVLIPIQCEYYALEGLSQLLNNIKLIEKHLNPTLSVSTILLTMYDSRTNLANQVADDVRKHFPAEVLDTLIPRSVRISEAPGYGQSVISYDPGSPGSLSYLEAAGEIARRGASA